MVMTARLKVLMVAAGLVLAACAAPQPEPAGPTGPWALAEAAPALRAASCPDGTRFQRAQALALTVEPVALEADIGPLAFRGGFHLTGDLASFGGLSGLAVMRSGSLLSVSDQGAFVWIALEDDAITPTGSGSLGFLLDAEGGQLSGKRAGDAEGLALGPEGLALVSFERDHRVLAYDLEGCGAAARGALVTSVSDRADGFTIRDNGGMEALALTDAGSLLVATETEKADGLAGFDRIEAGAGPDFDGALPTPGGLALTGMDVLGDTLFSVHRNFMPGFGNTIAIARARLTGAGEPEGFEVLAELRPPSVDNFEAIAARALPEGGTRLYLLSDDNFSDRQRTLLFVFDLP